MQRPVFLSVGGQRDAAFAGKVHHLLGDALAYHYQITGEENVAMWPEIEAQIQGCRIFVVFWSHDYLNSSAAKRELAFFRGLAESNPAANKDLILVPLESDGPSISSSRWINPVTNHIDEYVLGTWREIRAVEAGADPIRINDLIRRKLATKKVFSEVLIPRGWIVDQFKTAINQANYLARELLFVSGLEGDGRRTALRQYMLQAHPNRVEKQVFMDSVDGPEDLLIPLMDVAMLTVAQRSDVLEKIRTGATSALKEVRRILHIARDNKSYYIVTIGRFIGVDGAAIPQWMSEVLNVFKVGPNPLIFIVTSNPVTDGLLAHFPNSQRVRVPGLEEDEANELVHKLAFEDPHPQRWTSQKKAAVASACGSSPSLCKSVMHAMCLEPTLDFVDQIAKRAEENFGQALASLMAHWVHHYKDRVSDLMALRVIEKLGLTSKEALDEILQPVVQEQGEYDLYGLRDQGLVEQLSDGIYRIPPLVQRRLGDALWANVDESSVDRLFEKFSKNVLVAKTEYGAVYAVNAINTSLRMGSDHVALEYESYITLSMLFKSGLERYSNRDWKLAHRTLQRAMQRLVAGQATVDITTQIEIARYSGLAAVRANDSGAVTNACAHLESRFTDTKRSNSANAMAHFIRGFQHRFRQQFRDAVHSFEAALHCLKSEEYLERQRAAIYTELANVYLRTNPPNFPKALDSAKQAFDQKDVTHTLNVYLHALILYVFRSGIHTTQHQVDSFSKEIHTLLKRLEVRSMELGQDFHVVRNQEYVREFELWKGKYLHHHRHMRRPELPPDSTFSPQDLEFF